VHYEFYAQLQKPRPSVKIRIDRFGKFGGRFWPWTSAVLKGSLIIRGWKLTIAKDTRCTLEKQAAWRFFELVGGMLCTRCWETAGAYWTENL